MSGDILCKGNEVHQVCFISVNQITVISLFEMKFSFLVIIYFYCESFGNKFPVLIRGNVHMVIMHYTLISLFKVKRTSKGNYCKKRIEKKDVLLLHRLWVNSDLISRQFSVSTCTFFLQSFILKGRYRLKLNERCF